MKKLKLICIGTFSIAVLLTGISSFAAQDYQLDTNFSESYIEWQNLSEEEKKETLMPKLYTLDIPKGIAEENEENKETNGIREQILNGSFEKSSKAALVGNNGYDLSRYNLNDERNVNVKVKHQGETSECWAFSMTSVLETNLALTKSINKEFSPRHMDYSLTRDFLDGTDENNLDRSPSEGGLAEFAVAYLTNGKGAVLERDMPFENNWHEIYKSELNKTVDTLATETVTFPAIYKSYSANGTVTYTNGGTGAYRREYSQSEVNEFRRMIKNHITKYGAISAVTAGNAARFYSKPGKPMESVAYFCNDSSIDRDHAITIVGWDDNYSRDNFTGAAKPQNNGAYICLNTYGTENFDNGYIYISYEDVLIESYLYGIKSTSRVDYDRIYQYNPTGETTAVGVNGMNTGYIGEFFERETSDVETLEYVGINIPRDMYLNIYVNPNGRDMSKDKCRLVKSTGKLSTGYHRIAIDPVELNGREFAIVIKQTSVEERFEFSIEVSVSMSGTMYSKLQGNPGKSLFSFDGEEWNKLSSESVSGYKMNTADMTIKAFTTNGNNVPTNPTDPTEPTEPTEPSNPTNPTDPTEPSNPTDPTDPSDPTSPAEIESEKYLIKNRYISKVAADTTVGNFKNNIRTGSETIEIYDRDNVKLMDNDLVKTSAKVKLSNGTTYAIIVRGDTNCNGQISITDLSQIVGHYGDEYRYGLTGDSLKAADLNFDGRITITDVSQIVNILGNQVEKHYKN